MRKKIVWWLIRQASWLKSTDIFAHSLKGKKKFQLSKKTKTYARYLELPSLTFATRTNPAGALGETKECTRLILLTRLILSWFFGEISHLATRGHATITIQGKSHPSWFKASAAPRIFCQREPEAHSRTPHRYGPWDRKRLRKRFNNCWTVDGKILIRNLAKKISPVVNEADLVKLCT